MFAQHGIASADETERPLRAFLRDVIDRVSSPALASTAAAAFGGAWAIARYAPASWLGGVLAYSIAAGALAALADRRIAALRASAAPRAARLLVPLIGIRLFATGVALASAIAFVLFLAATLMGNLGAGG